MTEQRTGRTVEMLRQVAAFQKEHPETTVLVLTHAEQFINYIKRAADFASVDQTRLVVKTVESASRGALGRKPYGFFYDHAVWEHKRGPDFKEQYAVILARRLSI